MKTLATGASLLLLATALVLTPVACSSSDATAPAAGDAGVAPGALGEGGLVATVWKDSTCGSCITTQCASTRAACDAEPSCAANAACIDQCLPDAAGQPNAACVAKCPAASGGAATKRRVAYDQCVMASAPSTCAACGGTGGDGGLPTPDVLKQQCPTPPDPAESQCAMCEDEKCCDTYASCHANAECSAIPTCLKACAASDNTCKETCLTAHPNGVADWGKRTACLDALCVTQCSYNASGPIPVDPCSQCTFEGVCRDDLARCQIDGPCFSLSQCMLNKCQTFTDACLAACQVGIPKASQDLYSVFISCAVTGCGAQCENTN
jgi:hypothetical protein